MCTRVLKYTLYVFLVSKGTQTMGIIQYYKKYIKSIYKKCSINNYKKLTYQQNKEGLWEFFQQAVSQ